jgi:hypothetical protein
LLLRGVSEKYLNTPQKAWDCFAAPPVYREAISKWLREKDLNIEAKLVGVSPEIIQLYRVRTCIQKQKSDK